MPGSDRRVDTSNYQGWFKDMYGKAGISLVNKKTPLTSILMKNTSAEWVGDYFKQALRFGSGLGLGYRSEGENLPTPVPAIRDQALFRSKSAYATAEYTRQSIVQSKNDKGAFAKVTVDEAEATVEGFQIHNLERSFFGDGSGKLAEVDGSVTGAGTAASPFSFALQADGANAPKGQRRWFPKNAKVDVYSQAGVYQCTIKIVSASLNRTTLVVTLTAELLATGSAAAPVDNDLLYWQGNKDKEVTGLKLIAPSSAGTLYGLSQTTYPEMKGLVKSVTGSLEYDMINEAVADQEEESESPDVAIGHNFAIQALKNQSEDQKRIPMSEVKSSNLVLGFKGIEIMSEEGAFPLISSPMCPYDEIWLMKKKHLEIMMRQSDFGWFDEDGSVLMRHPDKDLYNARYGGYFELWASKPNTITRIKGFSL
jgi:hypothetical protein